MWGSLLARRLLFQAPTRTTLHMTVMLLMFPNWDVTAGWTVVESDPGETITMEFMQLKIFKECSWTWYKEKGPAQDDQPKGTPDVVYAVVDKSKKMNQGKTNSVPQA